MTPPDPPPPLQLPWTPPERVELVRRLGRGRLGEVHEAREIGTGRRVALRLIAPELAGQIGWIVEHLRPSARLEHPHLLPATLPQAEGGQLFYTMALAEAGSLRDWLGGRLGDGFAAQADGTPDPDPLLDLLAQTARGLASAHAEGQVHGHLTPENVLLQPRGSGGLHVWLSDFGVLDAEPSPRADLAAVGTLLAGGLLGEVSEQSSSPAVLAPLPGVLRDLILRCWGVRGPFPDAAALAARLEEVRAYLRREGPTAQADPPALRLMPGEGRTVRLRPGAVGEGRFLRLEVRGLPPEWVTLPGTVRAGEPLTLRVALPHTPRPPPGHHRAEVRVWDAPAENAAARGGPEELARLILPLEVRPLTDSRLALTVENLTAKGLTAKAKRRDGALALRLHLANLGDVPERYALDYTLPTGSRIVGPPPPRHLELPPGGEVQAEFGVRPAPAWLRPRFRRVRVSVQARPVEPPGERGRGLEVSAGAWQPPRVPLWAALPLLGALLAGAVWLALPPRIATFTASDTVPESGVPFALSWRSVGAQSVSIRELPGRALPSEGRLEVRGLEEPQTYTLVAQGRLTRTSRQVTVWPVSQPPQIVRFRVTPAAAPVGTPVEVEWNVAHARRVSLTPFGEVPARGRRTVVLERETAFRLSAGDPAVEGQAQDAPARTVVARLTPPRIARFTVTPPAPVRGQPVTARWRVEGARRVRLTPLGELAASGQRTFVPRASGPLVLKASNGEQEVLSRASVRLQPLPVRVTAFGVLDAAPLSGQPLALRWQTSGARQVELRWNGGRRLLAPRGELRLPLPSTVTRLTLRAVGEAGSVAEQSRPVTWAAPAATAPTTPPKRPPPEGAAAPPAVPGPAAPAVSATASATAAPRIVGFRADPPQVRAGERVTLRWQVSGAESVQLAGVSAPQGQVRPARGSVTLRPTADRTFVLRAGEARAEVRVRVLPRSAALAPSSRLAPPSGAAQAPPASTPAVRVLEFTARPSALRPGERATLAWRVSGAAKVYLAGLSGPNADGSFPPQGTVQTGRAQGDTVYVLNAGGRRTSLAVPLVRGAAPVATTPPAAPRPAPAPSAPDPASPVAGTWSHSFGTLRLEVRGRRVSGVLTSSRATFPGGVVRGTLSGEAPNLTLNARVNTGDERVALLLSFDTQRQTFTGLSSLRGERERWCGWRGGAVPPGCG